MKDQSLSHLDLFSGIGGFALAARWNGLETIQFVENEPYAQKVLRKNFPDVPIHGDIKDFDATQFLGPFLLTGGYPCQPFSQAGKRRGEEDDRHLWPAMFEIIRSCRPDWVLAENVAGHVSMGLDEVLSDLESEDYTTQPLIVPACAIDAPHRRDRVWIVAHSISTGRTGGKGCLETDRCDLREEVQTRIGASEDVADTEHNGRIKNEAGRNGRTLEGTERQTYKKRSQQTEEFSNSSEAMAHSKSKRVEGSRAANWAAEPDVGRVAHGIPNRVDRLKGLGNAIVPQVAYEIIKAMIKSS